MHELHSLKKRVNICIMHAYKHIHEEDCATATVTPAIRPPPPPPRLRRPPHLHRRPPGALPRHPLQSTFDEFFEERTVRARSLCMRIFPAERRSNAPSIIPSRPRLALQRPADRFHLRPPAVPPHAQLSTPTWAVAQPAPPLTPHTIRYG